MNVEIGAEAALFPEKEYINGIFVAVYDVLHFLYMFCRLYVHSVSSHIKDMISYWINPFLEN
jgi:hypothetical protein